MSKRNSLGSANNTLFNYFSKTPPTNKKPKNENNSDVTSTPINKEEKPEKKKRERQTPSPSSDNHSDEEPIVIKRRKKIRINPIESDDSDTENKDNGTPNSKEKISLEKKLQDSFKYDPTLSPQSRKSLNTSTLNKSSSVSKPAPEKEPTQTSEEGNWVHTKLAWLKPDKIRDAMKRRPDHPDYNPRTLFVPPDFMNEQTPAHRQWWEMKTTNYDCVLFFKVGKFYELFHMDAGVGVNELGFSYMKGEYAHSGFPESAYSRMASTLVSKGYKVARVEQTETPDMMQERCKRTGKNTKFDKVVQREICQITCQGIQVCGLQDSGPDVSSSLFLMSVAEEEYMGATTFGVCFVDTSIGWIQLGQFQDDTHFSRLLTTIAHYPPALVVYDRKNLSKSTMRLLNNHCHNARREPVFQAWNAEKTLKILAENYYKTNVDGDWPEGLKPFLHKGDALGLTPAEHSSLAIKALGGCVSYLTETKLDIQILGMSHFSPYSPPDMQNSTVIQHKKVESKWEGGNTMVLDAVTLKNLRIIQDEGCLYDKLNFCSTPMGKRLLYQWVCTPSCNISTITERQEAVKYLFENPGLCEDVKSVLSNLPDLERLLAKVHTLGNLKRSKSHPDARAIFYEEKIYSKRKVLDFISVLNGFGAALKLSDMFSDSDVTLLRKVTQFAPDGQFPDYKESLKFFKEAFNQTEAEKEGRILPGEGVDNEYDETMKAISDIENELKDYLKEQEKYFKCRLSYIGSEKKRYQIEVPLSACSKADSDYSLEGTRKGFKRFSTVETKEFLARMMAAEDQKTTVLKDLSRRIFEKFSTDYNKWETAIHCLSTVDVLMAIAEFARQQSGDVCLPEFTYSDSNKPYIDLADGRHPCIPVVEEFIPNDTRLGQNGTLLILTGPNMGGKSTLMRQLGLITVLAHLGGYVPASRCALSPVDRVFTRVGARDDILSGRSTFLVEMSETAAILNHATKHSLILLDELGRGTSTHEGAALAAGVCASLAHLTARTLLATHYHALLPLLRDCENLTHGHMACMVETDETTIDNTDEIPEETITFLYKLTPGACPKSYGFNAARLAGVPREITRKAHLFSKTLELEGERVRSVRKILKKQVDASDLRKMLNELSI